MKTFSMGWSCSACTYRNINDGSLACIVCDTKRTKKEEENRSSDLTDEKPGQKQQRTLFGGVVVEKKPGSAKGSKNKNDSTKRTEASAQQSTQQDTATIPSATYHPLSHEDFPVRKKRCLQVLKDVFGISELRNQQPLAVECALKSQSQIVVMATGGGKSLCYQLPAVVCGGTTVVISPLIALMQDQVASLLKKGIPAACINSSNRESENNDIYDRLLGRRQNVSKRLQFAGEGPLKPLTLVYVTPESLQTQRFQTILHELHDNKRLAGFAIDEAHCLSSWGHDFRPSYRRLDYIAHQYPNVPRMALTATATPAVLNDIKQTLKLQTAPCHVGTFDRPNIFYKCHYKDALETIKQGGSLDDLVKFISKQHKRATKKDVPCSGIIYVHKRNDTTFLANEIQKRTKIPTGAYHGKLNNALRTEVQEDWTSGKTKIAVATIAFGMGIDLAHVRYVVHWSIPKTLEGFYQESGRAGRDGQAAISLVYFSKRDADLFGFLIRKESENSKKKDPGMVEAGVERKQQALREVTEYCTKAACRRQSVLKHFGEVVTDPKTVCQGSCDFCANPEKVEKAINATAAMLAIDQQRKQASKKRKTAQAWNGQWDQPHGDDEGQDWRESNKNWEVEGLGITSSGTGSSTVIANFASKGFQTAKSLSEKLDSLEAMEEEDNGFVRFKTVGQKPRDVVYPEHLTAKLKKIPLAAVPPKPKERSSSEIAASAKAIKAELDALRAKQAALKTNGQSASAVAPPPPPPTFSSSSRRRK